MNEIISTIAKDLGFENPEPKLMEALEAAFLAGQQHQPIKEEVDVPDFKDNSVAKRMRELAGIPHKDNFV